MSSVKVVRRPLLHLVIVVVLAVGVWLVPEASAGSAGYHHLGAVTSDVWAGVKGRLQVTDPGVRRGTYDFVATRFMVKQQLDNGTVAWLEAGWSENGWRDNGGQVIYTYDSVDGTWRFHEAYPIKPGDRVWLYLKSTQDAAWGAYLWWRGGWRLLTKVRLPQGTRAHIEQFVEVYVDPGRGGRVDVPLVTVDHVALRSATGVLTPWHGDLATAAGGHTGPYCLQWTRLYHHWSAGNC